MTQARPIRVMQIITRLSMGSPAMHAALLTQRLGPPAYESLLVCGVPETHAGDMGYFAEGLGLQPAILPDLGASLRPASNARALAALVGLMREWKPDIVHTHLHRAGFLGRMAAWRAGVPVIVHTYHGHALGGEYGALRTRVFIAMERFAASRSDTLIALTQSLRRQISDTYHIARRSRITVLPLGLDLSGFAAAPRHSGAFRAAWGIPADAPLIGIVGQFAPVKNHALFLRAAALVRAQHPAARCVLVGDGEARPAITALIDALGLADCTLLTGWQRDLVPLYSDLNVLVNSSINEGTPTPIIEALTARCPVVATAVGGVPDMLDHGRLGLLVMDDHPEALADAILLALAAPPDAEAARALMLDRYGIDRLIHDMDGLYHGLLALKGRAAP